jgi:hypothetical protein
MSPEENKGKINEGNKFKAATPEKERHNPKIVATKPKASGKTANMSNPYIIPSNLRKPFKIPYFKENISREA